MNTYRYALRTAYALTAAMAAGLIGSAGARAALDVDSALYRTTSNVGMGVALVGSVLAMAAFVVAARTKPSAEPVAALAPPPRAGRDWYAANRQIPRDWPVVDPAALAAAYNEPRRPLPHRRPVAEIGQ